MEEKKNIVMLIEEILSKYGFPEVSVEEVASSGGNSARTFVLHTSEEDSRFLIGQYGNNLQALQYIVRMVVGRSSENTMNSSIFLDVNDYRKKKEQSVIDLARMASREAEKEGKSITLRPMSAYERRLVHMELSKEKNVTTESLGEGLERRIVVHPLNGGELRKDE